MIQRKQTLWLLLVIIFAALTYKFPFYTGTVINGTAGLQGARLTALDNIALLLTTGLEILLAFFAIFLYKNRPQQLKITFLGLVVSIGVVALYFYFSRQFEKGGSIAITALLAFLPVIFFFMAIGGIRRDQQLVRDLNRLR